MGKNSNKGSFSFDDDPGAMDDKNVDFTFSDIPVLGKEKGNIDTSMFDIPVAGGKSDDPALASFEALLATDAPSDSSDGMSPQEMAATATATNMEVDIEKVRSVKQAKRKKRKLMLVVARVVAAVVFLGLALILVLVFFGSGKSEGRGDAVSKETPEDRAAKKKKAELASLMKSARALLSKGAHKPAMAKFKKALILESKNPDAHAGVATCLEAAGEVDKAEKEFRLAIKGGVGDSLAYTGLARILLSKNALEDARLVLSQGGERFPGDKALARVALDCARKTGDDELALQGLSSMDLSDLDKESIKFYADLKAKDSPAKALKIYLYGAKKFMDFNLFSLAASLADTSDKKVDILETALKAFKKKGEDKHFDVLNLALAEARLDDGDDDGAKEALNAIKDLSKFDSNQCVRFVELHSKLGTEDMGAVVLKVLKARPNDMGLGLATRAILSKSLSQMDVLDVYGRWQSENPGSAVANFLYAKALGPLDMALDIYRKALRCDPSFYEANLELGKLYMARKRWRDAEKLLLKCVELRKDDVAPKRLLALCLARRGKAPKAMAMLNEAMDRRKASPAEKAAAAIDVALLFPNPREADKLLADLKKDPKFRKLYLEKKAERDLIYGGATDADFRGPSTPTLRRYHRLYLLARGKNKKVLVMPTPKEDFPEFWKIYLMRKMRFKSWRKNAELFYKKSVTAEAIAEHLIVGMWLGKITPEEAEKKLSCVPPEREALFYFMLGDAYKEKKNPAKAYINFKRAKAAPQSVEKPAVLRLIKG